MTQNTLSEEEKKKVTLQDPLEFKDNDPQQSELNYKPKPKSTSRTYSDDDNQSKVKITLSQGYDYKGEKSEIGVILALKNERFANKVVFSTFIEKMKNYVLTNFNDAKDMMPILESLKDPKDDIAAKQPSDFKDDTKATNVERWMKLEQVKLYVKRVATLETNKETLYALVWGQLSSGLQEVLKGEDDFDIKDSIFDCIWLLSKVKLISAGVDSKGNKHCNFIQALTDFCNVRQTQSESNDSFRKRIDSGALTLMLAGGTSALCSLELMNVTDPKAPTQDEVLAEIEKVKAIMMILRADPNRYASLQESLFDDVYKGRDEFPITVTAAYDLLQHKAMGIASTTALRSTRFRFRRSRRHRGQQQQHVIFTQAKNKSSTAVAGNDGKLYPHIDCHNCGTPGHYANQCPHAKKDPITLAHFSMTQQGLEVINKEWILLDTCSTVSVFCNPSLVKNIVDCKPGSGVTVITNGGSQHFGAEADLKLLPMRVFFNPESMANILSLSDIANIEGVRITMDTDIDRAIQLHFQNEVLTFRECIDGLYYWDSSSKSKLPITNYSTSFAQTVHNNKKFYSHREIQGADRARALQATLGWPSASTFLRIIGNNLINNSTVTVDDIKRADHIYGVAVPLLQGQMVRTTPSSVRIQSTPIPAPIIKQHPTLQLYLDFFFVNNIPFLHTKSSQVNFLTAHGNVGRSVSSIKKILDSVITTYESRGFRITDIHGDNEFDVQTLRDFLLPAVLHIYGRDEHVPTIERSNRTVKERCRAICNSLPYRRYTKLMVIMLVRFVIYWLNAIPPTTGVSATISPSSIVRGTSKPNFKYEHLSFGTYIMAYVGTKNNMKARSVPAIALTPSNEWGGFYCMSLLTGKRIHAYKWTQLPINDEVIDQVHSLALAENQPELVKGSVFFEWGAKSTADEDASIISSNDEIMISDEAQDDNVIANEALVPASPMPDPNTDTADEINDNISVIGDVLEEEMLQHAEDDDSEKMLNDDQAEEQNDFFSDDQDDEDLINTMDQYEQQLQHELHNVHHAVNVDQSDTNDEDEPVSDAVDKVTVNDSNSTMRPSRPRRANAGAGVQTFEPTMGGKEHFSYTKKCMLQRQQKSMERKTLKARITLLMKRARKNAMDSKTFLQLAINTIFLSAQMNANQGIKRYGDRAIAALIKECVQLDKGAFPGKPVVEPMYVDGLTEEEKLKAMSAVAIIKEKRDGKIKGRICANGSKQRRYLAADDTVSSPTVSNEAIITSFVIDAYERRSVAVVDIPGAYLHASMKHDKRRVLMKLKGKFVDYMCKANNKYKAYITYEKGVKVLYLKLLRALYGCIESALLWYELFASKLSKMGFTINPYDKCVANKMINGRQCTIVWYVDDAKISHQDPNVVRGIISSLEEEFGCLDPTFGNIQEYLGMKITIDDNQIVHIDMRDQICEIIQDFSQKIEGRVSSPASKYLMDVNANSTPLPEHQADEFHSVTAKLLYLEKRARPDIEVAVSFLTTRVITPNESDWNKLKRVLTFLNCTKDDIRKIGCSNLESIFTWIDASYAIHENMRSHTGGIISLGWGALHTKSSKQKLTVKSSTEAEIVGMSEYIPYNIWLVNFLSAQGYTIKHNVVYQDNQSAIRMENNGRNSCTGNSRHIHIRYFFVKDRIDKGEMHVSYCPTHNMLADFFTKPLQGSLFKRFRDVLMGFKHISILERTDEYKSPSQLKERVVISNNIKDGKVMKKNRIVSFDNDEVNEGKRETKEEERIMNSTKMTHEVQSDIIGSTSNKGRATNYIKENEMEKNKFQDEKNER